MDRVWQRMRSLSLYYRWSKLYDPAIATLLVIVLLQCYIVLQNSNQQARISKKEPRRKVPLGRVLGVKAARQRVEYNYEFNQTVGKKFSISEALLRDHGMPLTNFIIPDTENANDFAFVTGSSANHFEESRDAVASVQRYFPERILYYYDWGLQPAQRRMAESWCNVELVTFNFSRFPAQDALFVYTRVKYQSSKVFAVIEVLKQYPSVFWIDASIRFVTNDVSHIINKAISNDGFVLLTYSFMPYGSFEMTPPETFEYLPSNMTIAKKITQLPTNLFFIMRTEPVYSNVLWWWYLCCTEKQCIFPTEEAVCEFQKKKTPVEELSGLKHIYQNCTRADQSVLNVLAANYYDFELSRFSIGPHESSAMRHINRDGKSVHIPRVCKEYPSY